MAALIFDAGMITSGLRTICAFRIRVSMSAMGSVMLMQISLSPAGLDHAGNFAPHGDLAKLVAAQPEFAEHAARPAGQPATVAQPHGRSIPRHLLQLGTGLRTLFVIPLHVIRDLEQSR